MSDRRIRQEGLVDESIFTTPVHIVGAGGIGSFTTLTLAKMGFSDISVYDFDTVDLHNLPNQFYREGDIGKTKVEALRDIVEDFEGIEIKAHYTKLEDGYILRESKGIVILAVDNMATREAIFSSLNGIDNISLIVDGRMGGNQLEVYTCANDHILERAAYRRRLVTDEEAADVPCTQRAVIYNVATIASWIANQIRLVMSKKAYHRMLILDLENMILIKEAVEVEEPIRVPVVASREEEANE